eukprot:c11428_g1_i1.p1 GENE.c11428_g1_i1~~c11428_g1_i1.p1  ORF type:complete len:681 (-),score=143.85 c11428_g1_i1:429-2435(-)
MSEEGWTEIVLHSFATPEQARLAIISWDILIENWPSTRSVIRDHIMGDTFPPQMRTKLWTTASGAAGMQDAYPHHYEKSLSSQCLKTTELKISRDVPRTFGSMIPVPACMGEERALGSLFSILKAVCSYESPSMGPFSPIEYCQGLNFIAAAFLAQNIQSFVTTRNILNGDEPENSVLSVQDAKRIEEEVFWMVVCVVQNNIGNLFHSEVPVLPEYVQIFRSLIHVHLPEIHNHFMAQQFPIDLFAVEWFTCLFACSMPLEFFELAIDLFVLDTSDAWFAMGLALLKLSKDELLKHDLEKLMLKFHSIVNHPRVDVLTLVPSFGLTTNSLEMLTSNIIRHAIAFPTNSLPRPWINTDTHIPPKLIDTLKHTATVRTPDDVRMMLEHDIELFSRRSPLPSDLALRQFAQDLLFRCCSWDAALPAQALLLGGLVDPNEPYRRDKTQGNGDESASETEPDMGTPEISPLRACVLYNSVGVARVLLCHGALLASSGEDVSIDPTNVPKNRMAMQRVLCGKVCLHCDRVFDTRADGVTRKQCQLCNYFFCQLTTGLESMQHYNDCLSLHKCSADKSDVGDFRMFETLTLQELMDDLPVTPPPILAHRSQANRSSQSDLLIDNFTPANDDEFVELEAESDSEPGRLVLCFFVVVVGVWSRFSSGKPLPFDQRLI